MSQTIKRCQTLGQFFESLYILRRHEVTVCKECNESHTESEGLHVRPSANDHPPGSVTTQYGLPHYAYMTCWTCSFSFYLPCSSLTLCSIHTDNLVPLYNTTPLPLCPCPYPTYDAVLILSIAMSLFINTYASLYLQVYIPCTS